MGIPLQLKTAVLRVILLVLPLFFSLNCDLIAEMGEELSGFEYHGGDEPADESFVLPFIGRVNLANSLSGLDLLSTAGNMYELYRDDQASINAEVQRVMGGHDGSFLYLLFIMTSYDNTGFSVELTTGTDTLTAAHRPGQTFDVALAAATSTTNCTFSQVDSLTSGRAPIGFNRDSTTFAFKIPLSDTLDCGFRASSQARFTVSNTAGESGGVFNFQYKTDPDEGLQSLVVQPSVAIIDAFSSADVVTLSDIIEPFIYNATAAEYDLTGFSITRDDSFLYLQASLFGTVDAAFSVNFIIQNYDGFSDRVAWDGGLTAPSSSDNGCTASGEGLLTSEAGTMVSIGYPISCLDDINNTYRLILEVRLASDGSLADIISLAPLLLQ